MPLLDEQPFYVLKWRFPPPFSTNVPQRLKSEQSVAFSRIQDSGWCLHTP